MLWILFVTVLVLVLSVLYTYWKINYSRYGCIVKFPGPTPFPIVGNSFEFGKTSVDFFRNLIRLTKTYGNVVRVWIGPLRPTLIISNQKYLEFFLSSNEHINKSPGYDSYKRWLGDGLLNSNGETWRRHRKIITPTFHFTILEKYTEIFNSVGNILIEKLKEKTTEKPFDIYPLINLYALDVICESSMGFKIDAQSNGNFEYVEAVHNYLQLFIERFFSVLKRFDLFYKLTPSYRNETNCIKILKGMTKRVIDNHNIEEINDESNEFGIKKKLAFLDLLLKQQRRENSLNVDEINDEVNTLLFTGHHTITSSMSFCLFCLAKYPLFQEKILQEILDVVGDSKDEFITLKHTNNFSYLERFIKEVMRMYPPAPLFERILKQDVEIDGTVIPSDTIISFFIYTLHHSENLYPEPEKFDPDRFLPENTSIRHPFAYIPFSAGPRNCIGFRFAMVQLKVTLANILRNFIILPVVPEHELILANDSVLTSSNGFPIKIQVR